ncbi:uncharacterized protein LOC132293504 [Cornus florida]|uniref:uncharacterized protein LOC132293504 n=1 Tax=Cornus florida TaxID=4283 RepID=UPI002899C7A8|nr:uncharacterized protein LOC132293504 [Cornus florida]
MDISSLNISVSEGIDEIEDLKQLSLTQLQCTRVTGDLSLNDLGEGLTEFLHNQDDQKLASNSILSSPSYKIDILKVKKEDICEESCNAKSTIITSDKCLCKCTTFPCSGEMMSFAESTDRKDEDELDEVTAAMLKETDNESAKPGDWRPISLPTPLKPVSAMKGSREKHGIPSKKLTVTWAPDVYDPPPTSVSHVPSSKKQRQRTDSKKCVKNRQKVGGKSKRGKDKKHVRKYSGSSSNKGFKTSDDDVRLIKYNEPCVELLDFDVGSRDSYCGSSFLKESVTKMHLSVAEAT